MHVECIRSPLLQSFSISRRSEGKVPFMNPRGLSCATLVEGTALVGNLVETPEGKMTPKDVPAQIAASSHPFVENSLCTRARIRTWAHITLPHLGCSGPHRSPPSAPCWLPDGPASSCNARFGYWKDPVKLAFDACLSWLVMAVPCKCTGHCLACRPVRGWEPSCWFFDGTASW